ncbi:hypothetical protein wVul_1023 [Wolbachia endosymbiont of Armadillidium vulgare str. wVulC]|uniref:hypothetical protein n=1 Tax=Wolbachia endosymbiont of Armadillidium vulgare TaxID=77039 RepID=UPI000649BCCC|nr:hypothetical protein [Wolbachia endosymbiont of Armadillidium vulgare]KLT22658.1 hypothetical protein wVul_1023 [Wolbachia endosymbiont of Armadillidium vulgare str. wVulC]OJH32803.1 hypothetical protein Wxf_02262 [Wolbachia endosymbiont of Armadillidium vulgare]
MNNSKSEKKENRLVTLKAQAEKFNFSMLRVSENNDKAHSGETMFLDFHRMNFIVNKKSIDSTLTFALTEGAKENGLRKAWDEHSKNEKTPDDKKADQYKKKFEEFYNLGTNYAHLLQKEENGNYRPFAKAVFKEIFERAKVQVPSDSILEELVTNCNQAGYEAVVHAEFQYELFQHSFMMANPKKVISIDCISPNNVSVRSDMTLPILFQKSDGKCGDKVCDLSSSLEFTLESQDGKDDVIYKDGKLSLTVPRKLRDYKIDDRNLFDIIKEYFYKFCEKLGFKFEVEIEHDLGDPMSHLEDVDLPIHSNEHGNTP